MNWLQENAGCLAVLLLLIVTFAQHLRNRRDQKLLIRYAGQIAERRANSSTIDQNSGMEEWK